MGVIIIKKIYSCIIILCTIIYSCTMLKVYRNHEDLVVKNEINIEYEKIKKNDEIAKENQNKSYSDPLIFNKKKNKENTKEALKENIVENNEENISTYDEARKYKNKKYFYDDMKEFENNVDVTVEEFDSYNKNKKKIGKELVRAEAKEVLKQVSLSEKKKLITFAYKVPKKEFNNIVKYLNYENKDLGVKKIISVLEKYLTEEEIKEAKEIAQPFINKEITKEF